MLADIIPKQLSLLLHGKAQESEQSAGEGNDIRPQFDPDFVLGRNLPLRAGLDGRELHNLFKGRVEAGCFQVVEEIGWGAHRQSCR
jgi:hypothetical protein